MCESCIRLMTDQPFSARFLPRDGVDMHISFVTYDGLFKRLITTAKYGNYQQIFIDLSHGLISADSVKEICMHIKNTEHAVIVPVPMHKRKKYMRGYNQTELIAKRLSYYSKIPVRMNLVKKIQETSPQASLSRSQRQENVRGVFVLESVPQYFQTVILVDDVWTTGATIQEIAHLFKAHSNCRIIAYTLAQKWYTSPT